LTNKVHCQNPIAVVVLSYNGKDLHKDFFPELLAESKDLYDVILIDNASTNGTGDFVRTNFPQVEIITLPINRGFANGYFEGLEMIDAKYYVLLSADFEITPNWIAPMYDFMELNSDYAAVQPKIKYFKDKKMFEYAGAAGGFMDKYGFMFCRGRIFFTLEEDKAQYDDNCQVFWAGGGCLFVRSVLYHQVGGLDRDLYAHMEEIDLCWRLQLLGFKIGYIGNSTVFHIGGSVISYGSPMKLYYNYRNSLVLLWKNLPTSKLWFIFPIRLILDGVAGAQALFTGKYKDTITIFKAHFNFYFSISKWSRKRKLIEREVDVYAKSKVIYRKSIIWDYFIKKKKVFSDLEKF
jgi:GT2 family glycosyltransferase